MENKDIVIIALIVLVIYLAYQQNQSKSLNIQPNNAEINELKTQVNHYQTLYQKRVEKDLEPEKIQKEYQILEQSFSSLQQKAKELEQQLASLGQQKVSERQKLRNTINQLEKDMLFVQEN